MLFEHQLEVAHREDVGAVVGDLSSGDDDDVPIAAMVPSATKRAAYPAAATEPTVPTVPTVDDVPVKRPRGRPKGYRPSLMKKKPPPPASPMEAQDDEVDFEVDRDDDEPILRPSGTLDDVVETTPVKRKPGRPKQSRAKGSLE